MAVIDARKAPNFKLSTSLSKMDIFEGLRINRGKAETKLYPV